MVVTSKINIEIVVKESVDNVSWSEIDQGKENVKNNIIKALGLDSDEIHSYDIVIESERE